MPRLAALLAVTLLLAGDPLAEAQNLITNSDFDRGLDGWFLLTGDPAAVAFWSPVDSGGREGSGSALMTGIRPATGDAPFGYLYTNVVNVLPNRLYVLGGYVSLARATDDLAIVMLNVNWTNGGHCFSESMGTDWGPGAYAGEPWKPRLWVVNSPPWATAACVYLQNAFIGSFAAHLDRPYFGPPGEGLDLIFKDGFESGNLARWSAAENQGGHLAVSGSAALGGSSFGLEVVVANEAPVYVQQDAAESEDRYRVRFWFDPNGFDPGEAAGGNRTRIFTAFAKDPSRRLATIVLRRRGGGYSLAARVRLDDGTEKQTRFFPIADGPHLLQLDWRRASARYPDTGKLELWIDEQSVAELGGLRNTNAGVDLVRMGALSVKQGAAGTLLFDDLEARRITYVGLDPIRHRQDVFNTPAGSLPPWSSVRLTH